MLYSKQILVSTLTLGASVLNLTGCGQTGALYLPPPSTAAVPAKATVLAPAAGSPVAPASLPAQAPSANTTAP